VHGTNAIAKTHVLILQLEALDSSMT